MSAVEPICRSAIAAQSLAQTSTACIRYSGNTSGYFTRLGKKLPPRNVSGSRTNIRQGSCLVSCGRVSHPVARNADFQDYPNTCHTCILPPQFLVCRLVLPSCTYDTVSQSSGFFLELLAELQSSSASAGDIPKGWRLYVPWQMRNIMPTSVRLLTTRQYTVD